MSRTEHGRTWTALHTAVGTLFPKPARCAMPWMFELTSWVLDDQSSGCWGFDASVPRSLRSRTETHARSRTHRLIVLIAT